MRASAPRAVLPAFLVVALVAVVAVAATGSTQDGSDETRAPSDLVLDTFFTFALLALIPAAALLIYGLMQRRAIAEELASGKYRRTGVLLTFLILAAALAVGYYFRPRRFGLFGFEENDPILDPGLERPKPEQPNAGGAYEPELAWIPLLLVLALIAAGVGAYVVAKRRRERLFGDGPGQLAREAAAVLEESLDDLRAEPDARRAVIAAYARLERTFAASGLGRSHDETAVEHVSRILGELRWTAGSSSGSPTSSPGRSSRSTGWTSP